MRTTLDSEDLAQGRGLLARLPEAFSSILLTFQLEMQEERLVSVTYEISGVGKRHVVGSSSNEAIRKALVDVAAFLTSTVVGQDAARLVDMPTDSGSDEDSRPSSERSLSKARQQTLGATLPLSLKEHLTSIASSEATSFAEVCRRFVLFGFEDFVARSLYSSPSSLFEMLGHELHEWHDTNAEQVMVRLDPGHAARLRSTAKEYEKSVSELTVLCAAHGLVMQRLLETLESKVSTCKGAAVRGLVAKLGLQPSAAPLVSGILVGNVRAPRRLLSRLAVAFEAPESLLSTLFRGSFDRRLVPAFKAEAGKPALSSAPATWTSAVKSLSLPAEEAKALLELGV